MSRQGGRWRQRRGQVDPSRLVFIDEPSGQAGRQALDQDEHDPASTAGRRKANVSSTRLRTAIGGLATFLAALRNDRIEAPRLFDGPINGERFLAYVEQFLVPMLKRDDIVILDNLRSHKGNAVRVALARASSVAEIGVGSALDSIQAKCEKVDRWPVHLST